MNFFRFVTQKWKQSDSKSPIDTSAQAEGEGAAEKAKSPEENTTKRAAALNLPQEQAALAELAKANGELSLAALAALTDARLLAEVARSAESAEVRAGAVCKIDDQLLLLRIATQDTSALVRLSARARMARPDTLHEFLKGMLATLEVAADGRAAKGDVCGALDHVCRTLIADLRFEINGVLGVITPHFGRRASDPVATEAPARFKFDGSLTPARSDVELLAGKIVTEKPAAEASKRVVYYRIRISRTGENAFSVSVQER